MDDQDREKAAETEAWEKRKQEEDRARESAQADEDPAETDRWESKKKNL